MRFRCNVPEMTRRPDLEEKIREGARYRKTHGYSREETYNGFSVITVFAPDRTVTERYVIRPDTRERLNLSISAPGV